MKYLLSILLSVMFVTACGNEERFASVSEDTTSKASQKSDYEEEIKALVTDEIEVKISGKKRQEVDVVDTVGDKDLREKTRLITHIDVTSDIVLEEEQDINVEAEETAEAGGSVATTKQEQKTVVETTVTTEVTVTEETTVKTEEKTTAEVNVEAEGKVTVEVEEESAEEMLDLGPELNVLVYLDKRAYGACASHLKRNYESFLNALSDYNWTISFAYYTDPNEAELMPLEYYNNIHDADKRFFKFKRDYTLSKGEYSEKKARRLFYSTLEPANEHSERASSKQTPNYKKSSNPLGGLSQLLDLNTNKESRTVVLFFGDKFPYYSKSEWNNFYSQNPNVSLVALSYRTANVSNFIHVLEKEEYDFNFVAGCGKSTEAILKAADLK